MTEQQEREALRGLLNAVDCYGMPFDHPARVAARAALAAKAVPAGWKLVPVEPTDAMLDATYDGQHASDIYRDMLAATPPAPAPEATPAQAQQAEAQPLTDEQLLRSAAATIGEQSIEMMTLSDIRDFARDIERVCAEAWGVKLAGIGASTGGGNAL